MAKNSFFIRATVTAASDGTYGQTEIDLGSYTNLGSSKPEVLRIHNIQVLMTDSAGFIPTMGADTAGSAAWQLTTQSQSALVLATDDSFVAGGSGAFRNADGSAMPPGQNYEAQILAQDWSAGAVIAVPSLFLLADVSNTWTEDVVCSVILECTTEAMSKANAVALAISQQ